MRLYLQVRIQLVEHAHQKLVDLCVLELVQLCTELLQAP
jgi:hypothetical protein